MYEPWNALEAPRFTGPRTYARLPWVKEFDGVDAAVYGLPWACKRCATSSRSTDGKQTPRLTPHDLIAPTAAIVVGRLARSMSTSRVVIAHQTT